MSCESLRMGRWFTPISLATLNLAIRASYSASLFEALKLNEVRTRTLGHLGRAEAYQVRNLCRWRIRRRRGSTGLVVGTGSIWGQFDDKVSCCLSLYHLPGFKANIVFTSAGVPQVGSSGRGASAIIAAQVAEPFNAVGSILLTSFVLLGWWLSLTLSDISSFGGKWRE